MRTMRQHRRIPETIPIEVRLPGTTAGDADCVLQCTSSDISLQGIRLVSEKQLAADDVLQMVVKDIRSGRTFQHEGTVKWSRPKPNSDRFYAGIEFTRTDSVTMEAWRRYILSKLWPAPRWNDALTFASDYIGA